MPNPYGLPDGPLAAYLGVQSANAQQGSRNIENAVRKLSLAQHLEELNAKQAARGRLDQFRTEASKPGADMDQLLPLLMQNPEIAQQVMPVLKLREEMEQRNALQRRLSAIQNPQAQPPVTGSVNFLQANDELMGNPPSPQQPAQPTGPSREQRVEQLRKIADAYRQSPNPAHHSQAQRYEAEADRLQPKLQMVGDKLYEIVPGEPPKLVVEGGPRTQRVGTTRKVAVGEEEVTQEYQADGTWKEIGRGPRFARQVAPVINMPRGDHPLVPVVGPDGKPVLVRREDAVGKTPASAGIERSLPPALQKQLTEAAELADATERFKKTFKPTYGGKLITGDLTNVTGRIFGDDTGQAQWWQDYELHQSQVRNKLFGSALTAPEIEAWNKSAINPRMAPSEIQKNLGRRDMLEQRAVDRLIKGATAGKYNREQIEAFTGRSTEQTPQRRTMDQNPPKTVRFEDLP